jgi:putative ABC transport system permease protein
MKATALVRVAAKSMLKNKVRTLLTMLGVIIGVGAVIVMVAIGTGARDQIRERVARLGTNLIVITPGAAQQGGVSQGAQSFNRLTVADADAIRERAFLVPEVSAVVMTRSQVITAAGNWRTFVFGVATDYQRIRDWSTESGAFFQASDVRARRKVAVLGQTVSDALFADQDPLGQRVQLRGVPFDVIGVLARKGQTAEGTDQDDVILVPYTTAQTRLAGRQFIGQILAAAATPGDVAAAQAEIRAILRESHRLSDAELDDFTIRDQTDLATTAQEATRVMTVLLSAIASISLLVGGIGIMNIMLVSVTERTREIGLRLAVGARGIDVLTQFLVEAVVLSVAGGVIGVGLGFAGSAVLARVTGWAVAVSPGTVFAALLFSGAVGVFFGFYPARKAAALDPIEALRYE